jgi:hypothetical protein
VAGASRGRLLAKKADQGDTTVGTDRRAHAVGGSKEAWTMLQTVNWCVENGWAVVGILFFSIWLLWTIPELRKRGKD